jgi:hypothetical protein
MTQPALSFAELSRKLEKCLGFGKSMAWYCDEGSRDFVFLTKELRKLFTLISQELEVYSQALADVVCKFPGYTPPFQIEGCLTYHNAALTWLREVLECADQGVVWSGDWLGVQLDSANPKRKTISYLLAGLRPEVRQWSALDLDISKRPNIRGAPQFKNKSSLEPETLKFLKAFLKQWTPDGNKTDFCNRYAEKYHRNDKDAPKRLRKYLYRHLEFPS